MKRIGFIGLGRMGTPMAMHLLKGGFSLKVLDVVPSALTPLINLGAIAAASIEDIASSCDVIFTMLQTSQQVKDTCLGSLGLFKNMKKASLYIDSSSIDFAVARELHHSAEKLGIGMLDAPVSGGVGAAQAGSLTFMVGGNAANFERAKPLFEKMGKKIVHAGNSGSGQAAKICNNLILGISMIAVSEGFALAQQLGLDPKKFFEISSSATGQCWSMTSYCPVPGLVETSPANNQYKAGFSANMMLKDLRLGQHAAESVNASIPLASEAAQLYSLYVKEGNGETDFSGIINMFHKQNK